MKMLKTAEQRSPSLTIAPHRSTHWLLAVVCFSLLGLSSAARAQLAGYNFSGTNGLTTATATTYSSGLDSDSTLSRGAGAASSAAANSFRTTGFQNDGISITNTDYFQFSLSSTSGNLLSLTSIGARFGGTSTYLPATTQFAYSIDGGAYTLIGSPISVTAYNTTSATTQTAYDLSGVAALQNVPDTSTVTFRFYASGSTTTGGFGFFSAAASQDGLDVYGTVPEPRTILGGILMVGALGWKQRRRLRGLFDLPA